MNALVRAPLSGEILGPADVITVTAATHPLKPQAEVLILPAGLSLEEIVEEVGRRCKISRLARGADVSISGHAVDEALWGKVRVKAGAHVTVRARAGKGMGNIFRSLLMIALSVAATFIVGPGGLGIAAAIGGTAGQVAASLATGAIMMAGGIVLNALFPPTQTRSQDNSPSYSISAGRNGATKWGPIPSELGKTRAYPKFAALPYTEFVGDDQYLRLLVIWGYGPLKVEDIKIGATSIDEFDDVEVQTFEGYDGDGQQTLYPTEVVQEDLSVEPPYNDDVVHTSAEDANEIVLDFVAPQGLVSVDDDGDFHALSVALKIWMSPTGADEWTDKGTVTVYGTKSNETIRQSFRYIVLGGQWDVRVKRKTKDSDSNKVSDTLVWTAIKTFRTAPPIDFQKPLALTALRIRATKQLNGVVDTLSAVLTSVATSWNGSEWVAAQQTRNPADLFRLVLQGPANARPQPDSRIDLSTLAAFADVCTAKGYSFDMYRDFTASVRDTLRDIAAAARAVPVFKDGKWSVAWEDSDAPVIQHFTPRNSRNFRWTQTYRNLPHGLRCKFVNAAKDYVEDEILVFDEGYTKANATLYEQAEFPGVTSAELIYKHGLYRIADAKQRPAVYTLTVDFEHLVSQRADRVAVQYDVIMQGLCSGRIKAVAGQQLTLDEPAVMEAGKTYGIRCRLADGTSIVRPVTPVAGEQFVITITGTTPQPGDLYSFGESGKETGIYRILRIRPGEDLSAEIDLVDDGPNVQAGDGATDIPAPTAPTPTPMADYTPTNLRAERAVVQQEVGSVFLTTLYWNAVDGPDYASFEVIATGPLGRTIRHIENAAVRTSGFTGLDDGEWSFIVRAFFTNGTYTPPSAPLVVNINVPVGQTGVTNADLADDVREVRQELWAQTRSLIEQIEILSQGSVELGAGIYQSYQANMVRLEASAAELKVDYTNAILAAAGPDSAIVTAITQLNGSSSGALADATFQMSVQNNPMDGWEVSIDEQARVSAAGTWRVAGRRILVNADGATEMFYADRFIFASGDGAHTVNPIIFDEAGNAFLNGVTATSIHIETAESGVRTVQTPGLYQVFDENGVERVRLGVWDE